MAIVLWWVVVLMAAQAVAAEEKVQASAAGAAGVVNIGRKGYNLGEVDSKFFKSDILLSGEGYRDQLGSSEKVADGLSFPALQGLGISMARIDVAPRGFNPPHEHRCVSELMFMLHGSMLVGFVDPKHNTIFQQHVHAGDLFLYPRGLVHFQLNDRDDTSAIALSVFNTERPEFSRVAQELFDSHSTASCD